MDDTLDTPQPLESRKKLVAQWCDKVSTSKKHWEKDLKRITQNLDFLAGLQWDGQDSLDDDRYVCNLIARAINQKVATLYARDPRAIARRRKRRDFVLWDGSMEALMFAVQQVEQSMMSGMPIPPEPQAIITDYMEGTKRRAMIDKISDTLEKLYAWQIDQQEPELKLQMKQLVKRACACAVGYVRISFERDEQYAPTTSATNSPLSERLKLARSIMEDLGEEEIDENDPKVEKLRLLLTGVSGEVASQGQLQNERLVFDFPPPDSVIVDKSCRILKGFIGAKWIAQETIMTLDDVNAFFGTDIELNSKIKTYDRQGVERPVNTESGKAVDDEPPMVAVWEVFDKETRTCFFLVDGHDDFLREPGPLPVKLTRFWPIFPLVFNDTEVVASSKASIYPASDVQAATHWQKEWNRSRERLRDHRAANVPIWLVRRNLLSPNDKELLSKAVPHQVVELEVPPDIDIAKGIIRSPYQPIEPVVYDTAPLVQDMLFSIGMQEPNLGPASGKATATSSTIAEQSRLTVASSNIDDLDDLLSDMARAGGEILIQEMSKANVERVVGPGAVWPEENRQDFLNEIHLEVVAASSGRPNKQIEIANGERLIPLLLQTGANPMAVIEEVVKRLDDRLEVDKFFPVPGIGVSPSVGSQMLPMPQSQAPGTVPPPMNQSMMAQTPKPLPQLGSETPVPLAAA